MMRRWEIWTAAFVGLGMVVTAAWALFESCCG
jgi:hypothetical protein